MLTKIFIIFNKKKLRGFFTDFWPNFKLDDNYFYNLLSQKYELEIDPEKPEILFHSVDYSGEEKHKNNFYKDLDKLGFEGSFVKNFGKSSDEYIEEFNKFITKPWSQIQKVLP